jgi:hypothetical protein
VELNHPKVLFLSGTKMVARKAETELRQRLGFANAFGVNCAGLSGGLALLWTNDVVVDLKSYSKLETVVAVLPHQFGLDRCFLLNILNLDYTI